MSKASSTTAASRFASEWWRPSTATSKPSCAADAGTRTSATCSSRLSAWPLPKLNSSLSGEPHEMALRSNSCSEPLYLSDFNRDLVRRVNLASGIITTIAGNANTGFSGDNGVAIQAELNSPAGLAVDSSGQVFVADYGNKRVRKI